MSGAIRWGRALVALLAVSILQAVFFDQLAFVGRVRVDAPLLLVVGLAFAADLDAAAVLAFIVGMLVDVFQFGPFGLHALVYLLAVWGIVAARVRLFQLGATVQAVQGAIAVGLVTGLTWVVGRVFGQAPPSGGRLVVGLLGAVLMGAILSSPAARVAGWMLGERRMRRDIETAQG